MDYRSMVNPTYLTAKSTLYMLAGAGNEDAKSVIAALGAQDELVQNRQKQNGQKLPMPESDVKALMAGTSLAVEARYEALSRYMRREGCKALMDIACGYTPRSLYCDKAGIDYVGVDVPVVAEELLGFASKVGVGTAHPAYVGGDATNAASLLAAADLLGGELLISCEGLTQYLSADEFEQLIGGIREILIQHGGAWVTSDFGVDYEAFATANMASPDAVKLYNAARRQATSASNIYNEGVAYWDAEKKQAFLEAHGMIVEKLPFWAEDVRLNLLEGMPEAWKDNIRRLLKSSSLWRMTVDPNYERKPVIQGAKEVDNLRISYASQDDTLLCAVSGRVDTISAPALLEVFENHYDGISRVRIDAGKLEYISSAGLRVLLMAIKKLGEGSVTVTNASEPVKEIFETTGFDQMIVVE